METVISNDGTRIAFDRHGAGPPIVLVGGAFQYRAFDPRTAKLAELMSSDFTVFHYDRRGRGDSSNSTPYAVGREVEDLEALLKVTGAPAGVFGMSSGGALALAAARHSTRIRKLALYEAPFIVDETHAPLPDDFLSRMNASLAADRRGDAVTQFLRWVGTPRVVMAGMRCTPAWGKFKAVANTLPYDIGIIEEHHRGRPLTAPEWVDVTVPTLVVDGGKSPAWIRNAMQALAFALPDAIHRTLAGQNHMVKRTVLGPVLMDFFAP
jgi:pimeloyl-ACP methyl ester carboxylesterase